MQYNIKVFDHNKALVKTAKLMPYFNSLTNDWIDYLHNHLFVKLFHLALVASEEGHKEANIILQKDLDRIKKDVKYASRYFGKNKFNGS
ncbi:MAG: hypothetical protein LC116_09195 [Bacteroidetes bacterium]|nr:hypothetical protein [Bacteroidota bacterium]